MTGGAKFPWTLKDSWIPAVTVVSGIEKACPVEAIHLVVGTSKRGVEIPRIRENFETNVPGVYVVGEQNQRELRLVRTGDEVGADGVAILSGLAATATPRENVLS